MFQSLFLWNSRPDDDGSPGKPEPVRVSILVFVELAPGRPEPDILMGTLTVSILVFVELAPGLRTLEFGVTSSVGFNPCFCGTRARTFQLVHVTIS